MAKAKLIMTSLLLGVVAFFAISATPQDTSKMAFADPVSIQVLIDQWRKGDWEKFKNEKGEIVFRGHLWRNSDGLSPWYITVGGWKATFRDNYIRCYFDESPSALKGYTSLDSLDVVIRGKISALPPAVGVFRVDNCVIESVEPYKKTDKSVLASIFGK